MRYHVKCINFCKFFDVSGFEHIFSASDYRIAMQIFNDFVLDSYETVKKFDNYIK